MKKTRKINFSFGTLLICIALFATSCKKDIPGPTASGTSEYYMRFKANGITKEYKFDCAGQLNKFQTNPDVYASHFSGAKDEYVVNKNVMTVILFTNAESLLNVTYTNYNTTSPVLIPARDLIISYSDETGEHYGSIYETALPYLPAGLVCNNLLRITEANSVYLKGTFSGTIYNNSYLKKIEITAGEFYLKRGY